MYFIMEAEHEANQLLYTRKLEVCSQILHIPAPTTTTVTTTAATQKVVISVASHVTFTTTTGVSTTSTVTTTTSTSIVVSTAFSIVTNVQTQATTTTTTTTASTTTTTATSTTTVTSYTAAPLRKRANPQVVGDVAPDSPPELRGVLLDIASKACNCFVTTQPASTRTVTATSTVTTTATNVHTDTTIVKPSSTTTVVSTVVVPTTTSTTTTNVTTTTIQTTSVVITTTTTTSTSTAAQPVTTVVIDISVTYTLKQTKVGSPSCAYSRYYKTVSGVSGDPGPNNDFSVGLHQCEAACTADPQCKFFYYDSYNPEVGGFGECDLDNQPYDPVLVQCNLPTRFGAGYQKN